MKIPRLIKMAKDGGKLEYARPEAVIEFLPRYAERIGLGVECSAAVDVDDPCVLVDELGGGME